MSIFTKALDILNPKVDTPTKVTWDGPEGALFKGVPNDDEGQLFMALLKKFAPNLNWKKRGRGKRAELAVEHSRWGGPRGFDQDLPMDHASHYSLYPTNLDEVHWTTDRTKAKNYRATSDWYRAECERQGKEISRLRDRAVELSQDIHDRTAQMAHLRDLVDKRNATVDELSTELRNAEDVIRGYQEALQNNSNGIQTATLSCRLCGANEDARSMGEQLGVSLCRSCDGYYSDEELQEKLEASCDFSWEDSRSPKTFNFQGVNVQVTVTNTDES